MKKSYWDIILLVEIFILVFLTGFFPSAWHPIIFPALYSALYLTTVAALDKNRGKMLGCAVFLLVAQVIFSVFNLAAIEAISKALNFLFFSFIVVSLIRQIAQAKKVTERVILEAINGYLLLGLVFTFLIAEMIQLDSSSYNFSQNGETTLHNSLYFGFITFATLGYGDLVPLIPSAKSLSILIAVCGQLYLAIIIALLVGKFSSQSHSDKIE
jgi:voltage-gated potassium channel